MSVVSSDTLPVGYRFRPTDVELVDHYLRLKINGHEREVSVIREVDVCKCEPWDLPDLSMIKSNDNEWFFFCPKDHKYQNGHRLNRATEAGYWKATGKDRLIKYSRAASVIGTKKTLVFHIGRAPTGVRTNWVMHEYRATSEELDGTKPGQGAFVLCRLFKKQDEKQDENAEDLKCDEVEEISSSATGKSSAEDTKSESVTPILSVQDEKKPSTIENCLVEHSNGSHFDATSPIEWQSDIYNFDFAEDKAGDPAYIMPDQRQEEMFKDYYDPMLWPPDGKIFSPLHSHMQVELGYSSLQFPVTNDLINDQKGVQFQYGTNEQEIPECSKAIFDKPVRQCDFGVLSDAEMTWTQAEVAQAEVGRPKFDPYLEGHEWPKQSFSQETLHIGTSRGAWRSPDFINNIENLGNFSLSQGQSLGQDASTAGSAGKQYHNLSNAADGGDTVAPEIRRRTRTHQPQNISGAQSFAMHGTAPRRLLLEKKRQLKSFYRSNLEDPRRSDDNHEVKVKQTITEAEEAIGKPIPSAVSATATMDGTLEISLDKSNRNIKHTPRGRKRTSLQIHEEEAPPDSTVVSQGSFSISTSVYMPRVALVVVLFIIFIGLWTYLKF